MSARDELREAIGAMLTIRRHTLGSPPLEPLMQLRDAMVGLPEVAALLSAAERAEKAEAKPHAAEADVRFWRDAYDKLRTELAESKAHAKAGWAKADEANRLWESKGMR